MIIGTSPAIRRALVVAERYARTSLPVLLVGATGTGKELFAQHIHDRSGRSGPLVDLNCGALPRDMVESLLFGHRRGAFTGAVESSVGHIERSDGGTLFLDELASLEPEGQRKLLRVLETGELQPLGAPHKRRLDLRVVAAVQDDIWTALDGGRFRRDLFHRVAGVVIELPALAARLEDVVPLAEHFAGLQRRRLEHGAECVLLNYAWPGNVRELRMAIERAAQLVPDGTLSPDALTEAIALGGMRLAAGSVVRRAGIGVEREQILSVLARTDWDVERTSALLSVGRTTLFKKLKACGISLRAKQKFTRSLEFSERS